MPEIHIPSIFLTITRNPITALGLPLALGVFSGSITAKVVKGNWYKVNTQYKYQLKSHSDSYSIESACPSWTPPSSSLSSCMAFALRLYAAQYPMFESLMISEYEQ